MRALLLVLLLATPAPAQEAESPVAPPDPLAAWEADPTAALPAEGVELDVFEYVARPLVVFGDSPRQPQVVEQLRLIEQGLADLERRDVVVIVDTDPDARSPVRQALRPRGFGLVLVDKDGRVMLRQAAPTAMRELTRAIDRSPLREEELRNGAAAPAGEG